MFISFTRRLFYSGQADQGSWGSWTAWSRERSCESGSCVGNDTQTADDVCPDHAESPATCDPWSPWEVCSDSSSPPCSQIRTKECKETCDEGENMDQLVLFTRR